MNHLDLPPFPTLSDKKPQICETVRFYLAIVDELSFEQVRVLSEHVKECAECAEEFRQLQRATRLMEMLPESAPSTRVDAAVLAALQGKQRGALKSVQLNPAKQTPDTLRLLPTRKRTRAPWRRAETLALVAALLLVLIGASFFLRGLIFPSNPQAFQLPGRLSWNGYVLHYTQTKVTAQDKPYQVEIYQDLGTNSMHIESSMEGVFDIVVVTDSQAMLGKDMMHHIAQMGNGVENWAVDGSLFDLSNLRQDLATRRAVYLGKKTFQGQEVYQIRTANNHILLLNMQYLPVNVLGNASSPGVSVPIYQICTLLSSAQVSDSMWDMQVPPHFQMGELPASS
ncbi:MAG TPA: hypothetical protein VH164_16400 [Ktedonobacteraceae bacterium]|nr:hypothetical protein [Ktedonobacteraceae bacterium]